MGRNRKYNPETLKIGQKMQVSGKVKKFIYQYLNNFNRSAVKQGRPERFAKSGENGKTFIQRIA